MNDCFNGKELIGTERKPAVPECEANTYREAAVLPESRKMPKLEGCSTWAGAESKARRQKEGYKHLYHSKQTYPRIF